MTTLVSGFLTNVNQKVDCNTEKFYQLGVLFLQAKIPKIVFVDQIMYDRIHIYDNDYTKIILIDKTDYEIFQYMNNFNLEILIDWLIDREIY